MKQEVKDKLSISKKKNPTRYWLGKKRAPVSEDTRAKISIATKGKKKPPFTEEHKRNISKSQIGKKRPEFTQETREKMRNYRLTHPNKKRKDTYIEVKVEQELIKQNINYQKQVPLCKIAIVDFYLPEYKIIIQTDGDYWHNLPKQKEKDIRQDALLTSNGFKIYRFWEHEINKSVEECINKINLTKRLKQ